MDPVHPKNSLLLLLAALLPGCALDRSPEEGFVISLVGSGEVILSDRHIEAYEAGRYRIRLSPEGIERWESFSRTVTWQGQAIPQLGRLTGEEFVVSVRGEEMYRGHFGSMLQSTIYPGIVIFDTTVTPFRALGIQLNRLPGDSNPDPRRRAEIDNYFRSLGKLESPSGSPSVPNRLEGMS